MGRHKQRKSVDEFVLTDLYIRKNMTVREVAGELSVSINSVLDALHSYGISKASKLVHHDRKTITKDEVIELYLNQNLSLNATAERLGVGHSTLSSRLNEWGISKPRIKAVELRKKTNLEKYGSTCAMGNPMVQKKAAATCLEKYGDSVYFRTLDYRGKAKRTCISKYGCERIIDIPGVQDKMKATNLMRYGAPYAITTESVKQKIKDSLVLHYGVDNPLKCKTVQERVSNTWSSKTSEELDEIRAKRSSTCLRRYGCNAPMKSPSIQDKVRKTMQLRYGKEHASQVPEFKAKAISTNMDRYGVPYACQRKEARIGHRAESQPNRRIVRLFEESNLAFDREFPVGRFSYDFKVGNNLIEINPAATHNVDWSPFGNHISSIAKDYHLSKSNAAIAAGYRCIHIFDWDNVDAVMELLKPRQRVYARNCAVREVQREEATEFINKYHVQYDARASLRIGLYHDGELVSIMTFGKPRYNKKYEWELVRYCSKDNIVGGAERLFNHFIRIKAPESVVSYCDRSKFSGNIYHILGFESIRISQPCAHWCQLGSGMRLTDNYVRSMGFDRIFGTSYGKGTSNAELLLAHGFVRVYDCGQETFAWNAPQSLN